MSSFPYLRPLIVGEVLFDCFEDHRVLGGAPFNVAWNLKGMGLEPLMVSAVGQDDFGEEVLGDMNYWGMDPSGVQVLPGIPTGRVDIQVSDGQPTYRFWDDVAFDRIEHNQGLVAQQSFGLLYHGSLALRGSVSRDTISHMRRELSCPVFIDINVRLPHFDRQMFEPFLLGAEHVKLNDDELMLLMDQPMEASETKPNAFAGIRQPWPGLCTLARELRDRLRIKNLWLTAGSEGAAWIGPDNQAVVQSAPAVSQLVDTVGAGDALAAVIIRSILSGEAPQEALSEAVAFAARVCAIRGAITRDAGFYRLASEKL